MPSTALCTWVVNKSGESKKENGVNKSHSLNSIIFQGRAHEKMSGKRGR